MRTILHSDLNNFYASVELLKRPELKGSPVAVCGSVENRHGIVLAKNMIAKAAGVKTGETVWQAERKCPGLVRLPVDFPSYHRVSARVRQIYQRYTDRVEPFGIDECWLDVTESVRLFGGGTAIAEEIRAAVKAEIGVTVSVGVSWNKVFAKLGSDMKKPDAVTCITPENYQNTVWPLSVGELLYVGKATLQKLNKLGVRTIGDLARADRALLAAKLGKWGNALCAYANGEDDSPVARADEEREIKSIGNSLTYHRDLVDNDDVYPLLLLLSESVAARLRESGVGKARTVHVSATDNKLRRYGKQGRLTEPASSASEIAALAFSLFKEVYPWSDPVRAAGVSVSDFTGKTEQMSIFSDVVEGRKGEKMDRAVDGLRKKYGSRIIQRATILQDDKLKKAEIGGAHINTPAEEPPEED